MFQMKEQHKTSGKKKTVNEMYESLPDKVFKVMVIGTFTKLRRRMVKYSENVNKDIKI